MTAEQIFSKNLVPKSIFIIKGVILINNSTNLKQEKTISSQSVLPNCLPKTLEKLKDSKDSFWAAFSPKIPVQDFSKKKRKNH